MNNKGLKIYGLISIFVVLLSCQKEIDIDLNSANPRVVIEAVITDEAAEPCVVKLSKTVNFSDANTFPAVKGAIVKIQDDAGNSETLSEVTDGIYKTQTIQGVSGRTYTLTVQSEGKEYAAVCTMPPKIVLQQLIFLPSEFGRIGDTTTNYFVMPIYKDVVNEPNFYRFILTVNNYTDKGFVIFNDYVSDGLTNQRPIPAFGDSLTIYNDDTVTVEMQCIDRIMHDYYFSLNQSLGRGVGGGTTPANPVSNIEGGALGYFSAHTKQRLTAVAKPSPQGK